MKELIFPGCSLIQSAKDYYFSTKVILKYIGKEVNEIPEWECCGATIFPSISRSEFEKANKRNIEKALNLNADRIISPCSSCYVNLKKFSKDKIEVVHLLYYLYENKERIKQKVKNKSNFKVIPYYGCQTVRPFSEEDIWNPVAMDEILEICGFKTLNFPFKTKCCGGIVTQIEPDRGNKIIKEMFEKFVSECDLVSVVCPLCRINLEIAFLEYGFKKPILYLPQIMGISFGIKGEELLLNKSLIPLSIK